jgi:hypothetical protein
MRLKPDNTAYPLIRWLKPTARWVIPVVIHLKALQASGVRITNPEQPLRKDKKIGGPSTEPTCFVSLKNLRVTPTRIQQLSGKIRNNG